MHALTILEEWAGNLNLHQLCRVALGGYTWFCCPVEYISTCCVNKTQVQIVLATILDGEHPPFCLHSLEQIVPIYTNILSRRMLSAVWEGTVPPTTLNSCYTPSCYIYISVILVYYLCTRCIVVVVGILVCLSKKICSLYKSADLNPYYYLAEVLNPGVYLPTSVRSRF